MRDLISDALESLEATMRGLPPSRLSMISSSFSSALHLRSWTEDTLKVLGVPTGALLEFSLLEAVSSAMAALASIGLVDAKLFCVLYMIELIGLVCPAITPFGKFLKRFLIFVFCKGGPAFCSD